MRAPFLKNENFMNKRCSRLEKDSDMYYDIIK